MADEGCTTETDDAVQAATRAGRLQGETGAQAWGRVQALSTLAIAAELAQLRAFLTENNVGIVVHS